MSLDKSIKNVCLPAVNEATAESTVACPPIVTPQHFKGTFGHLLLFCFRLSFRCCCFLSFLPSFLPHRIFAAHHNIADLLIIASIRCLRSFHVFFDPPADMTVANVMHSRGSPEGCISIDCKATLFQAIELMTANNIGALGVLEGKNLAGIMTERDYLYKAGSFSAFFLLSFRLPCFFDIIFLLRDR